MNDVSETFDRSEAIKLPPLPRPWAPLYSEGEECPPGCARVEDMRGEYDRRIEMHAYARAIRNYGVKAGKDTLKKADRVVEFASELPAKKYVYIDSAQGRWSETPVRTPGLRSDPSHSRHLFHKRKEGFDWFEKMMTGPRPCGRFIRLLVGDLKRDSVQELDSRYAALGDAKANLPPAIFMDSPTTDGRCEILVVTAEVPTNEQLSDFLAALPGVKVKGVEPFSKNAFPLILHRWAIAGSFVPKDQEQRGKWEAVIQGHQQVGSNVPRRVQKICKESAPLQILQSPHRPKNPKTGLLAVGVADVRVETHDYSVPLCCFTWFDGIPVWERWPDESPPWPN